MAKYWSEDRGDDGPLDPGEENNIQLARRTEQGSVEMTEDYRVGEVLVCEFGCSGSVVRNRKSYFTTRYRRRS